MNNKQKELIVKIMGTKHTHFNTNFFFLKIKNQTMYKNMNLINALNHTHTSEAYEKITVIWKVTS